MPKITNLRAPLDVGGLTAFAVDALKIPRSALASVRLLKQSVDARDKGDVHFVLSFDVAFAPGFRFDEKRLPGAQASRRRRRPPTRPPPRRA
jgi:hypothetical protein